MKIDVKKLAHIMVERNMKSNAVAAAAGITPCDFSLISRGKRGCFLFTAGRIAKALGVEVEDIIATDDNMGVVASSAPPAPTPPVEPTPPAAEPSKPKREAKPKAPAEPPPAWTTDFELYKAEGRAALDDLLADEAWVRKMEQYLPGADVPLTVNRSWDGFWATEKGWINKKKAKTRKINWGATMLNIPRNLVVYKPRDPNQRRFGPQNLDTPEAKRRIYERTLRVADNLEKKRNNAGTTFRGGEPSAIGDSLQGAGGTSGSAQ